MLHKKGTSKNLACFFKKKNTCAGVLFFQRSYSVQLYYNYKIDACTDVFMSILINFANVLKHLDFNQNKKKFVCFDSFGEPAILLTKLFAIHKIIFELKV